MNIWRLIESPPSDIFSQMAADWELFEGFLQNPQKPPLLRIYRVTEPAVTVGRFYRFYGTFYGTISKSAGFKAFDNLNLELLEMVPSQVCVRPTGGGLVEHGRDLIYSVIARRDSFPTFHQVRTSYLSFHEAVQEALQKLGIETRLFRCDEAKRKKGRGVPSPCFSEPVATDVLANERKIAGGAQRRKGEAFLHQGSVQLPQGISFEILKEALVNAFEKKFRIVWSEKIAEAV